jgi:hypothetical protein
MPKTITVDVGKWQGAVVLHDPLTMPQVIVLERAIRETQRLTEATQAELDAALLPGLLGCVAEWRVPGLAPTLTAETFPGTPRRQSALLVNWLMSFRDFLSWVLDMAITA